MAKNGPLPSSSGAAGSPPRPVGASRTMEESPKATDLWYCSMVLFASLVLTPNSPSASIRPAKVGDSTTLQPYFRANARRSILPALGNGDDMQYWVRTCSLS